MGQHLSLAHQAPQFAPQARQFGEFLRPAPAQNRLLAALPRAEYARLLPALELVELPRGQSMHCAGDQYRHLYFPTSGIVSRFCVLEDGKQAGFALAGNDGALGVASFLSGDSTPSHSVVLVAGRAYRIGTEALKSEFHRLGELRRVLLRYTQALITQTTQTAACNRHHLVEQQLCRQLLSCVDMLPDGELWVTQEALSEILGVRREAVTEAAGKLQAAGIIHNGRGHIRVLDRLQLKARACDCYDVVRREYDRLLARAQPWYEATRSTSFFEPRTTAIL